MMKPKLTISVVTKTQIYALTTACISETLNNISLRSLVDLQQSMCIGQSDLPKARSLQLTSWYVNAKEDDIFMFIDADQCFRPDDVLKSLSLLKTHDVVCGAYPRKDGAMTVEPRDIVEFNRKNEGKLYFGATGFMMMTYKIVDKIAKHLGSQIVTSLKDSAYPFFFERIVDCRFSGNKGDVWLGEDYSFCWLVSQLEGSIYGYVSRTIGHIISYEKFLSPSVINTWPENSIVIFCGKTSESWSFNSLEKGIGGSETAVIQLSRYWAKAGYDVTIFCNCSEPGIFENVKYRNFQELNMVDNFNILIIWRGIELCDKYKFISRKTILDLHDIITRDKPIDEKISSILVKSNFHKNMLHDSDKEKAIIIPNGGCVDIQPRPEKDPNYVIYSSSYDRGLYYMLKWGWPEIKKNCKDAYLKIYYGWDGFDKVHGENIETANKFKKEMIELMKQEGVEDCGRISGEKLMLEKAKANVHYYVGNFQEIDCISVRESAFLGAIPVVSDFMQVFKEKTYCLRVPGNPETQEIQENAANIVISLIQNPEKAQEVRKNNIYVPKDETWEKIAQKWIKVFEL